MSQPVSPLPDRGPTGRRTKGTLNPATAKRVERPAPLRQVVYDALAELIINRTLEPGQHLVEADLAEYLGVSRQPVREALQRLQSEGWVDLRPAQGAFVHMPTDEEADQLLSVRTVLEAHSARLAADRAGDEDVERLWELQKTGLEALAADDTEGLVAANAALHAFITELSGNTVLAEMIGMVDRRVRWYYTPIARPRSHDAWQEHEELIKAIAAGDAVAAEKIMNQHTERTRQAFHERPKED
ncbi:GntR family transcriptional regulator [Amycolatopsis sp. WAC 01375]|uniref:GntR family transcriptional regulator n=1 Tax=unclassified Amycolatopsis TaxID=2618356 RepID=UPI000F790A82|nr:MULTISPECIES: GntR family transcriptional regulator [unclassified Amycolatopsis]RSM82058.1 GntR family transcriptional regulator [Amycolatopsis sp. WAC 01375]RSN22696.1 GntR family transcriptional regulator [Amycolatopsis sp. WAC 01416]